jgi:hypothetical protein
MVNSQNVESFVKESVLHLKIYTKIEPKENEHVISVN